MIDFSKILSFKENKEKEKQTHTPEVNETPWVKCKGCQSLMYFKEVESKNHVCPKCNYHMRMPADKRISLLCDENTFIQYDENLKPNDPLEFIDKTSYKKRLEISYKKTNRHSSVISGQGDIDGIATQIVVFDFAFMGGSLGSVEGEKITRAVTRAIKNKQGVVIVSASGGARMQESTFSLMQMSKTSAALKRLEKEKLPYISVLTDPTMGGVSASFATLGDIIIAEPGALIGFAGQRVIEQTINSTLPDGFQRAEFLLEKGAIDMIVDRANIKNKISSLLALFLNNEKETLA